MLGRDRHLTSRFFEEAASLRQVEDGRQVPGPARTLIWRFLPSRSRQWMTSPATLVTYTGTSSVRMMPESPLGRQYLMWFSVVYTSTFASFHAADCTGWWCNLRCHEAWGRCADA